MSVTLGMLKREKNTQRWILIGAVGDAVLVQDDEDVKAEEDEKERQESSQ